MSRKTLSSSSDEHGAPPSPSRRALRRGKGPVHDAPAEKKKRKATTPPRRDRGINIRDSPPHQRRRYVHRSESEGDDPEDRETLSSRAARQGLAAPLQQMKVPARRWAPSRQGALGGRRKIRSPRLKLKSPGLSSILRSGVARTPAGRPWGQAQCPRGSEERLRRRLGQAAPADCTRLRVRFGGPISKLLADIIGSSF